MRRRLIFSLAVIAAAAGAAAARPGSHHVRASAGAPEREATHTVGRATCGIERWPVKTLTDPGAGRIDFTAVRKASIAALGALPADPGGNDTRGPLETRVYRVTATLTRVKREGDSDYHLILTEGGASMIAEMPYAGCDRGGRDRPAMTAARARLVRVLHGAPGSSWRQVSLRVRVTGVLFFDFPHGQSGHAPNYAELHPVTAFSVAGG